MISWKAYFDRFTSIFMQFDLTRKAISGFKDTPEATKSYANNEIESLTGAMKKHYSDSGKDFSDSWLNDASRVKNYFEHIIYDVPNRLTDVDNRINQNELLIRMALLESFMKDLHREMLIINPTFLNATKKIPLGRAISIGFENILQEEIEKEVHALDRKNAREKSAYFKDKLSIDYSFDGTIIPLLEHAIGTRNKILHEEPNSEVDKMSLGLSHLVGMAIPLVSILQAYIQHPSKFEPPDNSEKLLEHFEAKLSKIKNKKKPNESLEPTIKIGSLT